jgi:hypothetical protein
MDKKTLTEFLRLFRLAPAACLDSSASGTSLAMVPVRRPYAAHVPSTSIHFHKKAYSEKKLIDHCIVCKDSLALCCITWTAYVNRTLKMLIS